MEKIYELLFQQEPWVRYRTRIDLLEQSTDDKEVKKDYDDMLKHELIQKLLKELKDWPGSTLKRHNDANLLYHKLMFLIDIGLNTEIELINSIADKILQNQSGDGPFNININIPTHFGGSGKEQQLWMLCDAPALTYILVKLGFEKHPKVLSSIKYMNGLLRENGWPCAACSDLGGKFRGPGNKKLPCPYATLQMLRLLSATKRYETEIKIGIDCILNLWEKRKETKPYLFAMGTDFKKLKAPLIWYDILHITDVLSNFKFIHNDARFIEMLDIIKKQSDENGLFKASSAWRAWKEWDFGQKKNPSGWISFLVYRILNRINN